MEQVIANGLYLGAQYALIALGLTLIFALMNVLTRSRGTPAAAFAMYCSRKLLVDKRFQLYTIARTETYGFNVSVPRVRRPGRRGL